MFQNFALAKGSGNYIGIALGLFLLSIILGCMQYLFLFFLLLCLYIFKEQKIGQYSQDTHAIYSPISGEIKNIETITTPNGDKQIKISFYSSIISGGLICSWSDMTIHNIQRKKGLFLLCSNKADSLKETLIIEAIKNGIATKLVIKSGIFPFYPRTYTLKNSVKQSEKIGFFVDGIVELYLPHTAKISSYQGQKTKVAQTVLGYFDAN